MSHTGTDSAIARVTEAQIGAACEAYREAYEAKRAAWVCAVIGSGTREDVCEREEACDEAGRRLLSLLRRQAEEGAGG